MSYKFNPFTGNLESKSVSIGGTWTPTLVNVTNISSSSVQGVGKWSLNQDIVTFSLAVQYTPSGAGQTRFDYTLPIASNFTVNSDLIGTSVGESFGLLDDAAWTRADTANDRGAHFGTSTGTTTHIHYIVGQYQVK